MFVHDVIPTSKRQKMPNGFLLVPATFSRSGIHDYRAGAIGLTDRDPMAVVKVYRPADEVFDAASMASFGRLPVTNNHPGGTGQVTLDNVDVLSVGTSDPEVVRDADLMCGTLLIMNKKAIADIEGGKTQLSNGYEAEFELKSGVTDAGEAYDAIQRNIRGNHIAIVDSGRGGVRVAIADKGDGTMKITLDGKEYEVDSAVADALVKSEGDKDAALKLATDAEEKATEAEKKKKEAEDAELERKNKAKNPDLQSDAALRKERDEALATRDAALAKIPTLDQLDARADARAAVLSTATRLVTDIDTNGKNNEAVRREVVVKLCADVKDVSDAKDAAYRSDDYIQARFDTLAQGGGESQRFAERNLSGPAVNDSGKSEKVKAREKMIQDKEDAWKTKPAAA